MVLRHIQRDSGSRGIPTENQPFFRLMVGRVFMDIDIYIYTDMPPMPPCRPSPRPLALSSSRHNLEWEFHLLLFVVYLIFIPNLSFNHYGPLNRSGGHPMVVG